MVDTQHSKCCGESHVGSSPTSGRVKNKEFLFLLPLYFDFVNNIHAFRKIERLLQYIFMK